MATRQILSLVFAALALSPAAAQPAPTPAVAAGLVFRAHPGINRPDWDIVATPGGAAVQGEPVEIRRVAACRWEVRSRQSGMVHAIDFGRLSPDAVWERVSPATEFVRMRFASRDGKPVQAVDRVDPAGMDAGPTRWKDPRSTPDLVLVTHGRAKTRDAIEAVRMVRRDCGMEGK